MIHYNHISIDRAALPSPRNYYSEQFPDLKLGSVWATVICPFHEDSKPSLSINLNEGYFRCHGCGAKGGDIISFHKQRNKMSFIEACEDLGVLA